MSRYITKSLLKKTLGVDSWKAIENTAIDAGENFWSGAITSAFSYVDKTTHFGDIVATGAMAYGIYNELKNQIDAGVPEQLLTDLTEMVLSKVISQNAKIVTNAVTRIIDPRTDADLFASYTTYYFNDNKYTADEVLYKITVAKERQQEKHFDDEESRKDSKFRERLMKTATYIHDTTYKISYHAGIITTQASYWMGAGPDWLCDRLDEIVKSSVKSTKEYTDNIVNVNLKKKADYWREKGEKKGKWLADKYNREIDKQVKKIENTKNKNIAEARIKAMVATKKITLKLIGRIVL